MEDWETSSEYSNDSEESWGGENVYMAGSDGLPPYKEDEDGIIPRDQNGYALFLPEGANWMLRHDVGGRAIHWPRWDGGSWVALEDLVEEDEDWEYWEVVPFRNFGNGSY